LRLSLPALLLLAACGDGQAPVAVAPVASAYQPPALPLSDTCGAAPNAALVGQPATALERVLIMRPVRLLRGAAAAVPATNPTRINFVIAPTPAGGEVIQAITCG
jgi:hypothetical protein